uniref:BamA/TamA family outer membrane protein n=1 Tax=Alloprevotella sp. TaxID=1872471 RepID=UPI003FEEBF21
MLHNHTFKGACRWITIATCCMFSLYAQADVTHECTDTTGIDSAKVAWVNDSVPAKAHNGIFKKIVNYFRDSNKQKPNKKIDFGFIPGPNYSATTGLGLGLLGTATYSADHTDPTLPRSNASVYSNMTTAGFFVVGLRGNHIFPHENFQLDYKVNLSTFSTSYWGMGYANADNDDNETDYRRNRINAMARFMVKLAPNTYIGPFVNYRVTQASDVNEDFSYLWQGQDKTIHTYTAGLSFTYDSRDFMLNASKGVFVQIDQTFTPRCFGNGKYNFSTTEATFATYGKLWKGAILAGELHGQFNYGHIPWSQLATVGSNDRMRGYYEGRYNDKNVIEGQVELRQHIKGRNGVVAWVALANAFPDFKNIAWRYTLPNAGVGYRWEFKKRINIRVDYGFTRNGGGFIFNINEAF